MRGRKPKPLVARIGEGDTRKLGRHKLHAKLAALPKASRGLPECPAHLRGRARSQWNLWRAELEAMAIDAAADAPLLEALCMSYATAVKAHRKVEQLGEVVEELILDASGKIVGHRLKRNPWLGIREQAHRMLQSLSSDFGLSPAARTRLSVTPPADSYADIEQLLSGPSLTAEEKKKLQ